MNKTRLWICCLLGGLLATLFTHTAAYSQGNGDLDSRLAAANANIQQAMQSAWLAESIVASRESASGRSFDPAYRASLKNTLAQLPATQLESLRYSGGEGSPGHDAVGDSRADLVYTPVTPCRVFDTRSSTAGILAGDTQRKFFVAGDGTTRFTNQGGNSGGCGIPYGPATAVIVNFVAVEPAGAGNLRAWASSDIGRQVIPLAAVMNYSTAMYALANGVAVPICDPAVTACASGDLGLRADFSSVHVVGDVVGYFRKLDLPAAMPMGSEVLHGVTLVSGYQSSIGQTDVVFPHNGSCLLTCDLLFVAGPPGSTNLLSSNDFLTLHTAMRDVTAGQNVIDSSSVYLTVPSHRGSVSATNTHNVTGGKTYRFGCAFGASTSGVIGQTAYSHVSWICR